MTTSPAPPRPSPVAPRATGRRRTRVLAWATLGLVLLAQGWQTTRLFPSLASIVDPDLPVVMVDHAIHEYHGALGAGFLKARGTTWGYDPYFMAGYPETPVWDSSSNLAILFNVLDDRDHGFRAYKLGLCAVVVGGFAALILGGRAAGLGLGELAVASVLAWVYFWVEQPVSFLRSGLFAFLGAGMGSGLLLGLIVRLDRAPTRWWTWVALTVVAAAVFFAHVTAPILVGPGALAFLVLTLYRDFRARGDRPEARRGRGWYAKLAAAVGLTVAANLIWLVPLWQFRGLRVGSGFFMTTDDPWYLWWYYTGRGVDGRTGLVLLILGWVGLAGWWFGGRRAAAATFGASILALILLTGFGSFWGPTKTLEPLRFRLVFCLLLTIPAASTVALGPGWVARKLGGGRLARAGVGAAIVGLLGTWAWSNTIYFQAAGAWLVFRRPLVVGLPDEVGPLLGWIKRETDFSARILFEDQLRLLEWTDAESVHWTPFLPALLGDDPRLFIGGLYQTAFIQHHEQAAFGDFQLGDRPIDSWTPAEIAAYADRYNLGWVACWSPLARFTFDHLPGATRVGTVPRLATLGRKPANNKPERDAITRRAGAEVARRYVAEGESTYALYRLDRPHSYFRRGSGRIVAVAPDRVELADVVPDADGVAVLSLHWLDTWATDPPTSIRPEPARPDPVPFIRIESRQPIPRLVLTNRGGW